MSWLRVLLVGATAVGTLSTSCADGAERSRAECQVDKSVTLSGLSLIQTSTNRAMKKLLADDADDYADDDAAEKDNFVDKKQAEDEAEDDKAQHGHIPAAQQTDRDQALASVKPFTMVSDERIRFMYEAVEKVNKLGVEGDLVEAGVWKGGSSMMMAIAQLRTSHAGLDRHSWLYDTFEGLPPPSSEHDDPRAKAVYKKLNSGNLSESEKQFHHVEEGKWNYAAEKLVQENMYSTGFPKHKIHLVKGKVDDTLQIPKNLPEKIAVLRLDTDWYDSTKAELKYLLPRLQPGGLLFIDDYCDWKGSQEAVDEMLDMHVMKLVRSGPFCAHAWKPTV